MNKNGQGYLSSFRMELLGGFAPFTAFVGSLLLHGVVLGANTFFSRPHAGLASSAVVQNVFKFDSRAIPQLQNSSAEAEEVKTTHVDDRAAPPTENAEHLTPSADNPKSTDRFFTVAEVSEPATPFSDWIVPWDVLRKAQVKEFVVRLWILDTGEVLQADVLNMSPANVPQAVLEDLSEWLMKTRTNPALKDGRPVASVRTIEVTLEL